MRTRLTVIFLTLCLVCLPACKSDSVSTEPEKITLHIGVLDSTNQFHTRSTETLEQLVRSYNIVSVGKGWNVEVVIDSYGMQGDRDAMLTLNSTLSSKTNAPDLLMVEGMPWQSYGDRGLLVDLYGWMEPEGSEGPSKDDFFKGPLYALEYGGKLFCLPAAFLAEITHGTEEYFTAPGPVDTDTLFETWSANAADVVLLTGGYDRLTVFRTLALSGLTARYVNLADKTCDFTVPDFARLLTQFNALPVNRIATLKDGESTGADVYDGTALVDMPFLTAQINYLTYASRFPDAVAVEIPGSDGAVGYCQYTIPLAITTSSAQKDAAWSFIDYCQRNINVNLPLRKARLDQQIRLEGYHDLWYIYENTEDPNPELLCQSIPSLYSKNWEMSVPYTREAHEAFFTLLDQPMCPRFGIGFSIMYQPTELENIILTEVEQYFNGKCTLEQCVAVIQERVELYLAEQG